MKKKYIWKLYLCKNEIVQKKDEDKDNKETKINRSFKASVRTTSPPLHFQLLDDFISSLSLPPLKFIYSTLPFPLPATN